MTGLAVLRPPDALRFSPMTFPAYRHLLEMRPARRHRETEDNPLIQPYGVGAEERGQPIAMALAELPFEGEGREPELLSLFVASGHRNRGVATRVLQRLQDEIQGLGFARVHTTYMTGKPAIFPFQNVLWKCGWQPPVTRSVTVRMTVEETANVPWLNKFKTRTGYQIFSWTEIDPGEREALKQSQERTGWIARDLQPWDFDADFEPVTSVGMRGPDGVVGWVINHAISPTTIRFTCSFIRKDLGRRARILPLYAEAISRLRESPYSEFCFVSPLDHPNMAAFAKRRIGPWAGFVAETRGSTRVLGSPREEEVASCDSPGQL